MAVKIKKKPKKQEKPKRKTKTKNVSWRGVLLVKQNSFLKGHLEKKQEVGLRQMASPPFFIAKKIEIGKEPEWLDCRQE